MIYNFKSLVLVRKAILRSTLFGKNSTLLRSTLLKRGIFDKTEKSILFKEWSSDKFKIVLF